MGIKSLQLVRILLYPMQMIVSSKSVSNIRVKGKVVRDFEFKHREILF